jgi:hypothetical protein
LRVDDCMRVKVKQGRVPTVLVCGSHSSDSASLTIVVDVEALRWRRGRGGKGYRGLAGWIYWSRRLLLCKAESLLQADDPHQENDKSAETKHSVLACLLGGRQSVTTAFKGTN